MNQFNSLKIEQKQETFELLKFENFLKQKYSKERLNRRSERCNYFGTRSNSTGNPLYPHWARNSTVFVSGALRQPEEADMSWTVPKVVKNILTMINNWPSYSILMYVDNSSFAIYSKYRDPCIYFIREGYRHESRTHRLAHARNLLLHQMRYMVQTRGDNPKQTYSVMMDYDEINSYDFQSKVFEFVMENANQWDGLSFYRNHFYDIWALRFGQYDYNALYTRVNGESPVPNITEAIVREITTKKLSFYPVISAFNGLAIYKYYMMEGCRYYGRNHSGPADHGEDCEHVGLHKCMIYKHGARIRIHNESLSGA